VNERIGGFCVTRDSLDIIALTCGHHLRLGYSRLLFFVDKSADGTLEFLQALSRRDPRISVEAIDLVDKAFGQEIKAKAVSRLLSEGIHIVLPFDQDEFWNVELDSLRAVSRTVPEGVIHAMFVQFIQDSSVTHFPAFGPFKIRYRAPAFAPSSSRAVKMKKPYLCFSKQKVGYKSLSRVKLGPGNHTLAEGPQNMLAFQLELFHLPLRSKSEIRKRARYQLQHFYLADNTTREGRARTWAASSADRDGCLNSEIGEKIVLVPDTRLRTVLLRAFVYMVLRHPILIARALWISCKHRV
jgi:hypothetical protein